MCKKLKYLISVVLLLSAAGTGFGVDVLVDFGGGTENSGWVKWSPNGWQSAEEATIGGVDFTIVGPWDNWQTRVSVGLGDDLTYDCVSFDDAASNSLTLTISNLAAGDYSLDAYFNSLFVDIQSTVTESIDSTSGAQPFSKDTGDALVLTSTFTATGPAHVITVNYSVTNSIVFLSGFQLTSTGALAAFDSDASGGMETVSPGQVPVVLTNSDSGQTYTVDYNVVGGTATGGGVDYTLADGTLTFDNNSTLEYINITVVNDGNGDDDETVILGIESPNGPDFQLGNLTQHTYTIIDPRMEFDFIPKGGSGLESTALVNVTVTLEAALASTATVDYNVIGGTATGGGVDYNMVSSGTLTFVPSDLTEDIPITIISDANSAEPPETIIIELTNPSANAKIYDPVYTYTILDEAIDLQVDFALTECPDANTLRSASAKSGWIHWSSPGWKDMYMHDPRWEDGTTSKPTDSGFGGTGIHACVTTGNTGQLGLHMKDLCRDGLGGGGCPNGNPQGDPICNTFLYAVDWAGPSYGDILLMFTDLPAGEYWLYSYHNHWEPCSQSQRNCMRCVCDMPPMPSITANPLPTSKPEEYKNYPNAFVGSGTGVTQLVNDYNISPTHFTSDDDLVPSLIKFRTDGSDVLIIYEADNTYWPDCARSDREGSRGILNAFELVWIDIVPDTNAPTPNPATFASAPAADGTSEITMTATTGSDISTPIQYYFDETSGNPGGSDSGWVTNPVYTDSGLDPNTQYTYTVQMRDCQENTGTVSSPANATTDSSTPPILYWALDESSGTTASDSSGNGNSGTLYNMDVSDWVTGAYGNALDFDGSNDYVYISSLSTTITTDMSISCWLKFSTFDAWDRVLDLDGMQILIDDVGRVGWDNDGGPDAVEVSTDDLDDNQWHHVVFLRSGTDYKMYIDNVADTTGPGTLVNYSWLYAGRRAEGSYYQGQLDEIQIFDNALTEYEINILYYGGAAVVEFDEATSAGIETLDPGLLKVVVGNPTAGGTYTIDYAVTGGTATGGGVDYTLASDTLTFNPGETTKDISIDIVDDVESDDGETIIVTLSAPNGPDVVLGTSVHTYTISDYDPDVAFDVNVSSEDEDVVEVDIAVSLSHASDLTVTVDYNVSSGTASGSGTDYTLLGSGTLTFASRDITKYISIDNVDDSVIENDETVILTLSNPTNAGLGTISSHTYTIIDNEGGLVWDNLTWYYSDDPENVLFENIDGDLEWSPEQGGQYVTRIPEEDLSDVSDKVEISYWWLSDGDADCGNCSTCPGCFDDDITCLAGTSDLRVGMFQADSEYVTDDGMDNSNSIFAGYKGYNWRFGPHMPASPTRWVDCTDETHKTGMFTKKPQSSSSLLGLNEGELDYIPGFVLDPNEWSLLTVSLERLSSSNVRLSITLNDTTYTYTDTSSSEQPTAIDVFGLHMRNARPYSRIVLSEIVDNNSPTPDPMTWASAPSALGTSSITMTATTATDFSGVEYYFDCNSGGGNDSGWQDSTTYTDTGLDANTQYCYKVQARDKSSNQNATSWSTVECDTTTFQQAVSLVRIDFGPGDEMSGWTKWNATSGDKTVNGVDFTLSNSGLPAGPKLRAITGGSSDDLTYDCISSEDGGTGTKTYTLDITNLSNGDYTLMTYFNKLHSTTSCTQRVKVDSVLKAGPSNAPLQQNTAGCLQLLANFSITSGTSQEITVDWEETASDGLPYICGFELSLVGDPPPDATPPTPNPATFSTAPNAISSTEITMTATTGSDPWGPVEYYFDETTDGNGATDSGWVANPVYNDSGLDPNTQYTYTVQMRDGGSNTGTASSPANATTDPAGGGGLDFFDGFESDDFETGGWTTSGNTNTKTGAAYTDEQGAQLKNDAASITKAISTVGYEDIEVGYVRRTVELDGGEYLTVEWSPNGTSWNTLEETQDTSWAIKNWELPVGAEGQSGFQVRFILSASANSEKAHIDDVSITSGGGAPDTDPPTPNPATFSTAPNAISTTEITMTATTGSDSSGPVEYYFNETTDGNGATDSGWVTNPVYNDSGLDPNTQYTYTVQMRDSVTPTANTGTASSPANATTDALDTSPPTPNPATFSTAPNAISSSEITMTATTGSDSSGPAEYYFNETTDGNGATDSGWVTNPVYNDSGLDPNTLYTYTVQMRDSVTPTANTGTASSPANATTDVAGSNTVSDFNTTADAQVREDNPNTNYGGTSRMNIRGSGSNARSRGYVKFVVSGVGTVVNATLKIYSQDAEMDVYVKQADSNSWTEGGLDWNNQPGVTGNELDVESCGSDEWVEFDLSDCVTDNGTYSFRLYGNVDASGRSLFTKERDGGIYWPVLSVTHQ